MISEIGIRDYYCPFMKEQLYIAGRNSGQGYPESWKTEEKFKPCIKESCALFSIKTNQCSMNIER